MAARPKERDPWAERQAEQRARRAATCVHFTGLAFFGEVGRKCSAGIEYDEIADGSRPGMALRLPCIPPIRIDPAHPQAACDRFEARGMERVRADEAKRAERLKRIVKIREAIVEHVGDSYPTHGAIPCPACGDGMVHYSMASNGHVHAKCSTEDCALWVE